MINYINTKQRDVLPHHELEPRFLFPMSCVSSSFIKFTLLFLMGTPSHHPFQWGFSHELKHPASLGTPWKPQKKEATQKKPKTQWPCRSAGTTCQWKPCGMANHGRKSLPKHVGKPVRKRPFGSMTGSWKNHPHQWWWLGDGLLLDLPHETMELHSWVISIKSSIRIPRGESPY